MVFGKLYSLFRIDDLWFENFVLKNVIWFLIYKSFLICKGFFLIYKVFSDFEVAFLSWKNIFVKEIDFWYVFDLEKFDFQF